MDTDLFIHRKTELTAKGHIHIRNHEKFLGTYILLNARLCHLLCKLVERLIMWQEKELNHRFIICVRCHLISPFIVFGSIRSCSCPG